MDFRCFRTFPFWRFLIVLAVAGAVHGAKAQAQTGGPPAVGVVTAETKPLTQTNQFIGRVQAEKRVNLLARVTGFLEKRDFQEGAEVKKGDLLYVIEQPPYQADVEAKQSAVDQLQAQLINAKETLNRAKSLLSSPAGQQSTYDAALASEKALEAQVLGAQAQLEQSKINLGYTEIRAPIDGKIGQTAINVGNYVGPTSGVLATIVSQDPMYVSFPVPVRTVLSLRERYGNKGGFNAVIIKIQLPNGELYGETGHLNFVNNTVSTATDTIISRGVIPNPPLPYTKVVNRPLRELFDGEFVTVFLESVTPVMRVAVPRAAILSDEQGSYVYVVNAQSKAEIQRIELAQSTPETAFIKTGLQPGEKVVLEGLQRIRPGEAVAASPASAQPSNSASAQ